MATRTEKKIDNRTEEEKNYEKTMVILFFTVIGVFILYMILSNYFYVEMKKVWIERSGERGNLLDCILSTLLLIF